MPRKTEPRPAEVAAPTMLRIRDIARQYAVSRMTVTRWLSVGVRGVRLRGTMAGGQWRIARADLDSFMAKLTADATGESAAMIVRRKANLAEAEARARAAMDELRRRGYRIRGS